MGCGYWGKNLVRNFAELGALQAVADHDPAVAARAGAAADVPALDLDQILSDPTIQGVVIATPAAQHYAVADRVLRAGKHVFVEKPLSLDLSDAERLCELADEMKLTLMVGHLLQYHPAFLALRKLVMEGALGRIQYLYSNRLNLGKFRREEDIMWSFAPHDISMILNLVGQEPEEVHAIGGTYLHKTIADITTTHLTFASGVRAHVFVSWLHPFKEQKLVVVGERGMAVFNDGEPWARKLQVYAHTIEWRNGIPEAVKAEAESVDLTEGEPLKMECRHFLECVRDGATPRTDGREGLTVLRVLQAADRSVKVARPVPLRVVGDDHAQGGVTVHESAFVDEPVTIGAGTKIWHFSHILAGSAIGTDCTIGQNVMIGPDVTVGNDCKIQNGVSLYKGVTLEDGVFCGPSCVFTNVMNPRAEVERKHEFLPTLVKRGASIGANATIVCGNTLGAYSFVAAGAVVTSDVPDHALVAGVPARRIGWMSHEGEKLGEDLVCPRSGRRYRLGGPDRLEELDD